MPKPFKITNNYYQYIISNSNIILNNLEQLWSGN